jgi:hypothetical protein
MREGTSISVREDGDCGTFLGWSDGVTDNERTITITSDTTISSRFDVATYSVSITAGEGGYLEYGNIIREYNECNRDWIYTCAYAYEGYYFAGWSDGNIRDSRAALSALRPDPFGSGRRDQAEPKGK